MSSHAIPLLASRETRADETSAEAVAASMSLLAAERLPDPAAEPVVSSEKGPPRTTDPSLANSAQCSVRSALGVYDELHLRALRVGNRHSPLGREVLVPAELGHLLHDHIRELAKTSFTRHRRTFLQ